MKTRTTTVGDILEGARAPYSHMDEKDARLFYSTMNALLVYANERLHVIRPERVHERPDTPLMLYTHGGQVAEELWKNRRIVEDFVSDNPAGLSDEQLECASQWRHALRDMFTVVDANADRAIFMNRDRLFVVGASQDPADSHVHHIPSLMLLTLLPFKGGIVTDGKTIHLSPQPALWALPLIAEQLRDLCALPIVETSEQLVDYASEIPDGENRLSRSFQKEVDRGFASGLLA